LMAEFGLHRKAIAMMQTAVFRYRQDVARYPSGPDRSLTVAGLLFCVPDSPVSGCALRLDRLGLGVRQHRPVVSQRCAAVLFAGECG
jgi:hypothetical protein